VELSGLPQHSYWLGIVSEILLGLSLVLPFMIDDENFNEKYKRLLLTLASLGVIGVMLVACYVHIQPNVPADVLPLKIKPPIIPGIFILVSLLNLVSIHSLNRFNKKRHNGFNQQKLR